MTLLRGFQDIVSEFASRHIIQEDQRHMILPHIGCTKDEEGRKQGACYIKLPRELRFELS